MSMTNKIVARMTAILLVLVVGTEPASASWLSIFLRGRPDGLGALLREHEGLLFLCALQLRGGICGPPKRIVCPSPCFHGGRFPPDTSQPCLYWKPDDRNVACGKTIYVDTPFGVETSCAYDEECSPGSKSALRIGYDVLPAVIAPADVVSVTPPAKRVLTPKQTILVKFNQSMDATSVKLSSEMRTEAGAYAFSRSPDQFIFNDTLAIPPTASWRSGPRILTIDLNNEGGKPLHMQSVWFVPAEGQAAVPDFNSCTTQCGARHFLPFEIPFSASGGFPPYAWRIMPVNRPDKVLFEFDGPPAYDIARFESEGVFQGPPTFCVACNYYFAACVKDQAESETCHQVLFSTGL